MYDLIMAEYCELWNIIIDGPLVDMKEVKVGESTKVVPKTRKRYNEIDKEKIEKSYKAKKLLVCGLGPDEYNRISICGSAKEIWDCLKLAHEGTSHENEFKVDMCIIQNENFTTKESETIQEMHTSHNSIKTKVSCLDEEIHPSKQIRNVQKFHSKFLGSKGDANPEARVLKNLALDELSENSQTHEMKKQQEHSESDRNNPRDLVPENSKRRDMINYVKLADWGD